MKHWCDWRDAPQADFAVLGDPVSHSLSPKMHRAAFATLGLDLTYAALRVPLAELAVALDFLTEKGYRGVNLTLPLKEEGLRLAREADEFSRHCGAVNTIRLPNRQATNTDGPGFLESLTVWNLPPKCKTLIMGAGGSARAVAFALAESGHEISLWNRSTKKAAHLIEDLKIQATPLLDPALLNQDLLVDCTGASLQSTAIPIDWTQAKPSLKVVDLAYSKLPTPLIEAATEHNLEAQDGKAMLVGQGALALEFWLDIRAPRTDMLSAIL